MWSGKMIIYLKNDIKILTLGAVMSTALDILCFNSTYITIDNMHEMRPNDILN